MLTVQDEQSTTENEDLQGRLDQVRKLEQELITAPKSQTMEQLKLLKNQSS